MQPTQQPVNSQFQQLCGKNAQTQGLSPMSACVPGFDLNEEAAATPTRIAKSNNVLNPHPTATVTLRGISIPLASDIGGAFLSDCAKNRERIMSDDAIREKYGIEADAWADIIKNPAVRLAVNAEAERRVRTGDAARDSAAKLFATAPEVLGKIMNDPKSSPRHVIEAAKEIRAQANVGSEKSADDVDRVHIVINLGADQRLEFNKQVTPINPDQTWKNLDAETE